MFNNHLLRRAVGNTLILVIVGIGMVAVLLAYFAINFGQLMGAHKESQTAIDAAALQAAKDMSSVVVDGPLGRMAVTDDPHSSANGHPILGVNTVYATLRLDALIANQLGNSTMLYLVKKDLISAKAAASLLKDKLVASANGGGGAYDKNGQAINIRDNALQAYKNNRLRRGFKQNEADAQNFSVKIGTLNFGSGIAKTIVPTPVPSTSDSALTAAETYQGSNGTRYYRANVAIPVPGIAGESITLGAMGGQLSLIDNNIFNDIQAAQTPVAIQVAADEQVNATAPGVKGSKPQGRIHVIATAQAGRELLSMPTGTLVVSFPEGFPAVSSNMFNTVKQIMNASMLDATSNNPTSKYDNWNAKSKGKWFEAKNGPVPGSGTPKETPFKGITGRDSDDPSVSLAFLTYDWLRSVGLRPNVKSVIDAFNYDFKNQTGNKEFAPTIAGNSPAFCQPAYAEDAVNTADVITGILTVTDDGSADARDLELWNTNIAAFQRQQARMWGYLPADTVLPAGAAMVKLAADGDVVTVDNNPVKHIDDLTNSLITFNQCATQTWDNANEALHQLVDKRKTSDANLVKLSADLSQAIAEGRDSTGIREAKAQAEKKLIEDIFKEHPSLASALVNGAYGMQVSGLMKENLRTLTGGGVRKISEKHYRVMGTDFWPATRAATVAEILSDSDMSPTDQDPGCHTPCNWFANPKPNADKKAISILNFFRRTEEPVIGRKLQDNFAMQPAFAQSAVPPNKQNKFVFYLKAGTSTPGTGTVLMESHVTSPFSDVPIPKGQVQYQNTSALIVEKNQYHRVIWQVQARDINANAYPTDTNVNSQPNAGSAATHYTDNTASGYNKNWCDAGADKTCPALAAEWAITCPIPVDDTPKPPTNPPGNPGNPVRVPPPQNPPCGTFMYTIRPGDGAWYWTPFGMCYAYNCYAVYACSPPVYTGHT
jgi:hypothetical protein